MSIDWQQVRSQFPALAEWTFLNTATFGQLPRRATDAVAQHFVRRDRLACHDFMSWFDDADCVRASIARLIHAAPEDIAFVPNASTALSLLVGGIDWRPGDRVVTLENEFPNQYYYPALLGSRGVEFVETTWDRFYDNITPSTRLVLLSTVGYTTGFRAPLAEIAPILRSGNVLLYLDGTQSVGALEFDASAIQPDLFAVHGYKWLLSPNGAGFMYVNPRLRETLPPNVIGWRSHQGWRNPEDLYHGTPEFKTSAEKYEGGMLSFALNYAMGASVEMMLEIGPKAIEERALWLAERTRGMLRELGAELLFDRGPHYQSPIIAARFEGQEASDLARRLKDRRVLVAARRGYLRVSPHFYNDESDLESFRQALQMELAGRRGREGRAPSL